MNARLCALLLLISCGDDDVTDAGRDAGTDGAVRDGSSDTRTEGDAIADTSTDASVDAPGTDAGSSGLFPPTVSWRQPVDGLPAAGESDAIIADLDAAGGWGNSNRFQIDFSIEVLTADGSTPFRAFTPTDDHYSPDCDTGEVPVPPGGAIEGETGYTCDSDGDCHLLVLHPPTQRLFEMWRANIVGDVFEGGCLAVWDLTRDYGDEGRGIDCTSADAAGLPITPLLFSADEVQAGEIDHAIRFILPNNRVRARQYVPPATHATNTSGGSSAPPYGVRLRLRADYDLASLPNEGARVVARALQRYGMVHADGGNIALTAQSDRFTDAKWEDLLGPRDLAALQVTDFEVVALGEVRTWTGDCVRAD